MKKLLTIFSALCISLVAVTQTVDCYPTFWFTGMKNPKLQIIVHAKGIGKGMFSLNYPGVSIEKVNRVENPNYAILDVTVAPDAPPGNMSIMVSNASPVSKIVYELRRKNSEDAKSRIKGVNSSDFIYLIMPDRFANGDPSNDAFPTMQNPVSDRTDPFARHGGDLKGVEDHLDYFSNLGVTTIWLTPVVENDMPLTDEDGTKRSTYHGYAFTNQYQVDRRLGGNEAYKKMVDAAHAKGLKVIQDAVYNHVGDKHWSIVDMPMKDWVHQWRQYTNTSYKEQPIVDPYASDLDRRISLDGWFTRFMPDLNQKNPFVANFLIQYAIWATENFGIDGWRVDTYFYNDPAFLNKMNDALLKEFPSVTVFGEALVPDVVNAAYFCQNNLNVPFKHNLQGVTDHPLYGALKASLTQPFGWSEGMNRVYQTLAQDFLYRNPMRNCIYLDNHDLDRFYSVIGEDFDKYKLGITMLLTIRGIPEIYYGTEILMKNRKNPTDAEVRRDFPGGWPGDPENKFNAGGRNEQENKAFEFVKALAQFRKNSSALKEGKTLQYVPEAGAYTYFRLSAAQSVMVILNAGEKGYEIKTDRFEQGLKGFSKARNIVTNETFELKDFTVAPKSSLVLELVK
jgi:glycosidase